MNLPILSMHWAPLHTKKPPPPTLYTHTHTHTHTRRHALEAIPFSFLNSLHLHLAIFHEFSYLAPTLLFGDTESSP